MLTVVMRMSMTIRGWLGVAVAFSCVVSACGGGSSNDDGDANSGPDSSVSAADDSTGGASGSDTSASASGVTSSTVSDDNAEGVDTTAGPVDCGDGPEPEIVLEGALPGHLAFASDLLIYAAADENGILNSLRSVPASGGAEQIVYAGTPAYAITGLQVEGGEVVFGERDDTVGSPVKLMRVAQGGGVPAEVSAGAAGHEAMRVLASEPGFVYVVYDEGALDVIARVDLATGNEVRVIEDDSGTVAKLAVVGDDLYYQAFEGTSAAVFSVPKAGELGTRTLVGALQAPGCDVLTSLGVWSSGIASTCGGTITAHDLAGASALDLGVAGTVVGADDTNVYFVSDVGDLSGIPVGGGEAHQISCIGSLAARAFGELPGQDTGASELAVGADAIYWVAIDDDKGAGSGIMRGAK
jgi:hypothetical protein